MSTTILIAALLAAATPDEAEAPKDELRGLVKKLTASDASPKTREVKEHTNAAPPAAITTLKKGSSSQGSAGLVLGGVAVALAVALYAAKGRAQPARPLRRLAAETIGARQQIVLVEALGEYLLVATGGKEPVLLAQLDREQAKARLEAMQGKDDDKGGLGGLLDKLKKKPDFEHALGAAEDRQEAPLPEELAPAPDAEILRAQAALRSLAANRGGSSPGTAQARASIAPMAGPTRIGSISPKAVPARVAQTPPKLARSPVHGRADEIRRRLNSI